MKKLFLFALSIMLISACAPSAEAIQTAVAETSISATETIAAMPTETLTASPMPTNTRVPTRTRTPRPTPLPLEGSLVTRDELIAEDFDLSWVERDVIDLYDYIDGAVYAVQFVTSGSTATINVVLRTFASASLADDNLTYIRENNPIALVPEYDRVLAGSETVFLDDGNNWYTLIANAGRIQVWVEVWCRNEVWASNYASNVMEIQLNKLISRNY